MSLKFAPEGVVVWLAAWGALMAIDTMASPAPSPGSSSSSSDASPLNAAASSTPAPFYTLKDDNAALIFNICRPVGPNLDCQAGTGTDKDKVVYNPSVSLCSTPVMVTPLSLSLSLRDLVC